MPFSHDGKLFDHTVMLYRAESLWDHLLVRWRRYKRSSGVLWYSLGWLWEFWYDPASVEESERRGQGGAK